MTGKIKSDKRVGERNERGKLMEEAEEGDTERRKRKEGGGGEQTRNGFQDLKDDFTFYP